LGEGAHPMNEEVVETEGSLILEIPGSNRTQLTGGLADEFRSLGKKAKRNLIEMALLAAGVRENHKNASGGYNKAFHDWYSKNRMDEVFGTKSNFSKYASAGTAIVRHNTVLGGSIDQLPLSISALYVLHDMSDEEAKLCMEDHFARKDASVTDKAQFKRKAKKPQLVINPAATAGSINSWLKKWRNPPVPVTDTRRLGYITIKADLSVYDFDVSGSFAGKTSVEQLEAIEKKVRDALVGEAEHVLVESKLHDIKTTQKKRHDAAVDAAAKKKTKK
jgi:hypothetical protein